MIDSLCDAGLQIRDTFPLFHLLRLTMNGLLKANHGLTSYELRPAHVSPMLVAGRHFGFQKTCQIREQNNALS
jgi:hypothetical protein